MLFRKPNILAFNALMSDWDKHVKENHEGKNYDCCCSVGYMYPGFTKTNKLTSGGFIILVKPNIITMEVIKIHTNFAQTNEGIAWTIIREADNKQAKIGRASCRERV